MKSLYFKVTLLLLCVSTYCFANDNSIEQTNNQSVAQKISNYGKLAYFAYKIGSFAHGIGASTIKRFQTVSIATSVVPPAVLKTFTTLSIDTSKINWAQLPETAASILEVSGKTVSLNIHKLSQLSPDQQQFAVAQQVIRSSKDNTWKDLAIDIGLKIGVNTALDYYNVYSTQAIDFIIARFGLQEDDIMYVLLDSLKSANSVVARSSLTKIFLCSYIKSKMHQSRELAADAAAVTVLQNIPAAIGYIKDTTLFTSNHLKNLLGINSLPSVATRVAQLVGLSTIKNALSTSTTSMEYWIAGTSC